MATDLLTLYQRVAKEIGYAQGLCSGNGAAGGTTIVDSSGDSPLKTGDSSKKYQNWYAMIEAVSSGSNNLGEVREVTAYTPSTQTLTVPAFTYQTANTMTYGLYPIPPTRDASVKPLLEYINETLRDLFYWYDVLLTVVIDGDMETSGVSNWTTSNSTATKSTSTGVTKGDQALRVLNSSANGYARPAAINVDEGQVWDVCVDATPASGKSCQLQTYDATNSAEIDITDAYDGNQSVRLWLTSSIPDGCKSLEVRLIGVESDADIYWDNLSVRHRSAVKYSLPSWFVSEKYLDYLWAWRPGAQRNYGYAIDERRMDDEPWYRPRVDHAALTPYEVEIPAMVPQGAHLFAKCTRPYAEFTHSGANLTGSTTDANADWVKAWVLAKIYADRQDKQQYERWLRTALSYHAQFQPRISPRLTLRERF